MKSHSINFIVSDLVKWDSRGELRPSKILSGGPCLEKHKGCAKECGMKRREYIHEKKENYAIRGKTDDYWQRGLR